MKHSEEAVARQSAVEGRAAFLLARSIADLERICKEIEGLFSLMVRRGAVSAAPSLLGVCIDAQAAANVPYELEIAGFSDSPQRVRIAEAMGVNGIWMLCFPDAPGGTIARADLLDALLNNFGREQEGFPPLRFIPVFPCDGSPVEVDAEMQILKQRHSDLLHQPAYVDSDTGTVLWRFDDAPYAPPAATRRRPDRLVLFDQA